MPSLEDFLGKQDKSEERFYGWEVLNGIYGCKKCNKETNNAYFNSSTNLIKWVCPDNHESELQLD
jgi:hypothetical protein